MKHGSPLEAAPAHLGDAHNFGRRVTLSETGVRKPRTLLWEWLLLAAKSPLRTTLAEAAQDGELGPSPFAFLPDLAFSSPDSPGGGEVERLTLEQVGTLTRAERKDLARVVGRALALFSWLGLADLHWENLALGRDDRGHIVFAPLDVELILADLAAPTETKLLPDGDPEIVAVCRHASGVRRVLPYLGKPVDAGDLVALAGAYLGTLRFLDRHAAALGRVFEELPALRETPIRILLRGTGEYVTARSSAAWPPLLDAEAEQLARGDIPYFFRLYGKSGIHYYGDAALSELRHLPRTADVAPLEPLLSLSRGLRSPSRTRLREQGLFTVLGAFDHPSFTGRHEDDALAVTFKARALIVNVDKDELETRRKMSAFVGSVYLPCRCGEVREVFVPAVTACR